MKMNPNLAVLLLGAILVSGCASVSGDKSCWTDQYVAPDKDMPLPGKVANSVWWWLQGAAYGFAGTGGGVPQSGGN
jgi:hypothetical protein